MAKVKEKENENAVLDHKCLVYWHKRGVGTIPFRRDGEAFRVNVFPGYNTVNFADMGSIAEQCRDIISQGYLTLYGMTVDYNEEGKASVKETTSLMNISATELRKIAEETTNPATLDDLGNPDVVGVKNQDIAAKRIEAISAATGLEPENIDIKD